MINPNLEAERAVIGAIIMKPDVVMCEAMQRLTADDFVVGEYQSIYKVCKSLYSQNKPIDTVTVLGKLGPEYKAVITQACEATPSISGYQSYIELVKASSIRRKAVELSNSLVYALESGKELGDCQAIAVKACEALNNTVNDITVSAADGYINFLAAGMEPKKYIKMGLEQIDRYTHVDKGDYIIVGGRPSSGKTALTLQLMLSMAREHNVVYFSLETNAEKIFDRLICQYTSTPMDQIKRQEITNWIPIAEGYDSFKPLKFHVVEAAGWTTAQIQAKAVQLKAEVIFIDYLSLIKAPGKSIYERVTNISISLHTIAQQNKITVIALSQLNREGKGQPDMTNLRESGQIEQDADVILLLYTVDESKGYSRELMIAKNKEGSTGVIKLDFDGQYQRFTTLETRYGA